MAMFSTDGTLVGAAVTIQLTIPTAFYTEVHNLSPVNTYTVNAANVTFQLPPMRKLVLTNGISQVILTGTGAYIVMANSDPQEKTAGPKIEPTFYGTSGNVSSSPADNVTLEDTGIVLQEKAGGTGTTQLTNLGVTTGKLADLAVNFNKTGTGLTCAGIPGAGYLAFTANPADAETITVTASAAVVYEFNSGGGVAPGNIAVTIGINEAATAVALQIAMGVNQPELTTQVASGATFTTLAVAVYDTAEIQAGTVLALVGSASVTAADTVAAVAEDRHGVVGFSRTVSAADAATGNVSVGVGTTIVSFQVQLRSSAGRIKAFDGIINATGTTISAGNTGAAVPFVAGDILEILAFVRY